MNSVVNNYLRRLADIPYLNRWIVLAVDTIISTFASFVTILTISIFSYNLLEPSTYLRTIIISAIVSCIVFFVYGTYKNIMRHTRMQEVWRLFMAVVAKCFILVVIYLVFKDQLSIHIDRIRIAILELTDIVFSFFLLVTIRACAIYIYSNILYTDIKNRENILIYNDDNVSVSFANMLTSKPNAKYRLVGFIKMSHNVKRLVLAGHTVFYIDDIEGFQTIVRRNNIKQIIFPSQDSALLEKDRLINYCIQSNVKIKLLPQVSEISDVKEITSLIREIKIEDLLGRDEIKINMAGIKEFIDGKTVLITGGAGSIGSELARLIFTFNTKRIIVFDSAETPLHDVYLNFLDAAKSKPDFSEDTFKDKYQFVIGDIRSKKRIEYVFEQYRPDIIFHAAAYKHVPMMEINPCEAAYVNIIGTRNVAEAAVKYGAEKMIMISTDKAVNPTNVMGCSKRIAEIYVQSLSKAIINGHINGKTKFITTRFGNVLGSNGSVIPRFREQILCGGPVTVTHKDIIRYFMTIPEACRLVLEAATMGNGYEIFAFDMGEPVKISDLAKRMISLAGFTPDKDIKIAYTGLRPGEKLYEEVLSDTEKVIPTDHEKIFVAKVREYEYENVKQTIDSFYNFYLDTDKIQTVKLMKEIVPEFVSQNSIYCTLDQQNR